MVIVQLKCECHPDFISNQITLSSISEAVDRLAMVFPHVHVTVPILPEEYPIQVVGGDHAWSTAFTDS